MSNTPMKTKQASKWPDEIEIEYVINYCEDHAVKKRSRFTKKGAE